MFGRLGEQSIPGLRKGECVPLVLLHLLAVFSSNSHGSLLAVWDGTWKHSVAMALVLPGEAN